jgi:drug/metabolite transporter (DMT)-like permease
LLYFGSGLGLAATWFGRRVVGIATTEAPLRRGDLPWLTLIVFSGGVAGPVLLMIGLSTTPASTAALLLNIEGLATMGIAWLVLRENVDRRVLLGAALILSGSLLLSWQDAPGAPGWGALAISAACLAWGIDNNLTRKLSALDPVLVAMTKGLFAGAMNLGLAIGVGTAVPDAASVMEAAAVGFLGYGVSLALFVLALRHLGTARTGAYFSTAPFIGATLAVLLLNEPVTVRLIAAGVLMALGLYLHLAELHEHEHEHPPIEHEHRHLHDEHHAHEHGPFDPPGEPHTHRHRHVPLAHRHPHYPDLHHRHGHANWDESEQ